MALFGWSLGFLAAGLLGLTQHANHRLATILLIPAGVGSALLLLLVLTDLVRNRGHHDWVDLDEVDGPEHIPSAHESTSTPSAAPARAIAGGPAPSSLAAPPAGAAAAATQASTAARVAALEDRLAAEQQQLDEMIHAMAEADAAVLAGHDSRTLTDEEAAAAAELEPVLRQQVLDALVELVGDGDVLPQLESLTARRN